MSDNPYDWKLPPIPSGDAVVISRQALQDYGAACWRQGVKRGKYEARNSVAPGQEGLSQQGRGGPDTDDQAAPGSTVQ